MKTKPFGQWLVKLESKEDTPLRDLQLDFHLDCNEKGIKPKDVVSPLWLLEAVQCTDAWDTALEFSALYFQENEFSKVESGGFVYPHSDTAQNIIFLEPQRATKIVSNGKTKKRTYSMRCHELTVANSYGSPARSTKEFYYYTQPVEFLNTYALVIDESKCSYYSLLSTEFSFSRKSPIQHIYSFADYVEDGLFGLAGDLTVLDFYNSFVQQHKCTKQSPTALVISEENLCSVSYHVDKKHPEFLQSLAQSLRSRNRKIPLKMRRQILERDGFKCVDCGRSPRSDESCILHVDHRVPASIGGSNDPSNLQTLCDWCNLGKFTDTDWKLKAAKL